MKTNKFFYYQQGDIIIKSCDEIDESKCKKLKHLILAEGETTGHMHQIISGQAALLNMQGQIFLKIISDEAVLKHKEHKQVTIKKGNYIVHKVVEWDYDEKEKIEVQD